ncbi:hypothetical protein FEM48_Zijuj01G0117000 [Ziziphus jujuba var. spinosa]|uniref:Uncharacterized protein n=1 Tax=Ziziphus jujuba var. spinosa TaxID=714518 RepID=A0A978W126_ZIZJJ|nr:hypothetical protein FEM48_Zijuj01G0117000 [Ziziphus jujuba var. spinosa]
MTQIWLLWWPKNPTTTTIKIHGGDDVQEVAGNNIIAYGNATTTTRASTFASASASASSSSSSHCSCVSKLVRKLKRNFRTLGSGLTITSTTPHQAGSKYLQCRYDPLSYSLNFDSSGSGCGNLDEDYYHFYAFSSRALSGRQEGPQPFLASSCFFANGTAAAVIILATSTKRRPFQTLHSETSNLPLKEFSFKRLESCGSQQSTDILYPSSRTRNSFDKHMVERMDINIQ